MAPMSDLSLLPSALADLTLFNTNQRIPLGDRNYIPDLQISSRNPGDPTGITINTYPIDSPYSSSNFQYAKVTVTNATYAMNTDIDYVYPRPLPSFYSISLWFVIREADNAIGFDVSTIDLSGGRFLSVANSGVPTLNQTGVFHFINIFWGRETPYWPT